MRQVAIAKAPSRLGGKTNGRRKFLNAVSTLDARLWMCVHFAECACKAIRAGDHSRADRAGRSIADMLTSHDITCGDGDTFATYVNTTFATLIMMRIAYGPVQVNAE